MHETTPYNAQRLAGDTHVVPGLTNAGFIDGLLVDVCDDPAPYALTRIDTVVVTHGHADHFSIAHMLRESGARVFVARDDAALVENPDINIRGMFSWAKPGDLMVTRLFRGTGCGVDGHLEQFDDPRVSIVPLPGHTLGHCGVLTIDGVFFTGDALYQTDIWDKHPLPYAIDPGMVVESLERIRTTDCRWVVPGHGRPMTREQAEEHIDHHLAQVASIESLLLDRLATPHTTEQAVAMVSEQRDLPQNPAAYWLAVTTVKGFLGQLQARESVEFFVDDHTGWWRTRR